MLFTDQRLEQATTQTPDAEPIAGSIDELRDILAFQQQRDIGHDEAREIGHSLIEFYQVLAEEVCDESTS